MNKEWVTDGRMFDWLNRLAQYVEQAPNMQSQTVSAMIQRFATSQAINGNGTEIDVGLVLDVMHSTLVHNLKYPKSAASVGELPCKVLISIPLMIRRDWQRRGQSDTGFNVEDAFAFYMEKIKMDPAKVHPVQLTETRRAFYGGVSTYLRMLSESSITTMEDALAQLKDVERQCAEFWAGETKPHA